MKTDPAKMDCVEFLQWLDDASVNQLEAFGTAGHRCVFDRHGLAIVGEQGPEIVYDVLRRGHFVGVASHGDTVRKFVPSY